MNRQQFSVSESLCLACGLCCNGALFRDVELQPGDDAARLRFLGFPVKTTRGRTRLPQPCPALDGCRCGIYPERPSRCRQFDCALQRAVADARISPDAALRTIHQTRRRLARVERWLRQLESGETPAPLQLRFRRLTRRFLAKPPDAARAGQFGQLTLAFHTLNLRLRRHFLAGTEPPLSASARGE